MQEEKKYPVLIGLMTVVWLVLMASIIWKGTDGKWNVTDTEKISQLEIAKYANQIIVVSVLKEDIRLCLFECDSESENKKNKDWKLVLETEAVIGKNGLGKRTEGDGKTPIGVYIFTKAFGILENHETKMEYIQVGEEHCWVDDSNSKYYNQLVSMEEVEQDWESAEHIVEYGESYHYVLATSYNIERILGKGSAVFLHCMSEKKEATEGCIAIPEVYMKEIMKRLEPECVLIIDYAENILMY